MIANAPVSIKSQISSEFEYDQIIDSYYNNFPLDVPQEKLVAFLERYSDHPNHEFRLFLVNLLSILIFWNGPDTENTRMLRVFLKDPVLVVRAKTIPLLGMYSLREQMPMIEIAFSGVNIPENEEHDLGGGYEILSEVLIEFYESKPNS